MKPVVYLIGALKNRERIMEVARKLREVGCEVFDDWLAAGPDADDEWQYWAKNSGLTYRESLRGYASKHVVSFDHHHLKRASHAILVLPGGKSAHMELGFIARCKDQKAFVLFEGEPGPSERWDQMYGLVFEHGGDVFMNTRECVRFFEDEVERYDGI